MNRREFIQLAAAGASTLIIPVVGTPNTNSAPLEMVTLTILANANVVPGLPVSGFVSLATIVAPYITGFTDDTATVTINFSGGAADPSTAFHLQSATAVGGPYADDTSAVIGGGAGVFQATTAVNGPTRFYRIRR